ncbi:MAG: hypothetical protein HUK40_15205 [Desulfobacter sp.]|nr:hypothetical protein [Desulfobacter sp.]WDP88170.1 MAG: hypothetical protein HUN05_20955 [Desulfobacter sp.]
MKIYDVFDNLVRTIQVDKEDTSGGENTVSWNGVGDDGHGVSDGLYYYTVTSESGTAKTLVTEEVSGIKKANGTQFLVLQDSGRLVALFSITAVNN